MGISSTLLPRAGGSCGLLVVVVEVLWLPLGSVCELWARKKVFIVTSNAVLLTLVQLQVVYHMLLGVSFLPYQLQCWCDHCYSLAAAPVLHYQTKSSQNTPALPAIGDCLQSFSDFC